MNEFFKTSEIQRAHNLDLRPPLQWCGIPVPVGLDFFQMEVI